MVSSPTEVDPEAPPVTATVARDGKRVARNSILNVAGVIIPAVIAVIATPVLLNNLGAQGFGIFSIQLAVLVLIGVNDFGVSRAVTLEAVARGGFESDAELKRVVWAGTHLIATVAMAVFIIGGLILMAAMLALPMSLDERISWGLLLPASAISLITLPARASLEVQERFAMANVIRIGGSSLLFAAPAIASFIDPTMTATSIAMLLSRLALSAAAIAATHGLLARPNWSDFVQSIRELLTGRASELHRKLIHRGGWLGAAGIASNLIGYVDRFALGILASATIIAHYVVAAELVTKMWLITGALTAAIMPRLAHYWQDEDAAKFKGIFLFLVGCMAAISLSAHMVFVFFGDQLMQLWLGDQYFPEMAEYLAILSVGIAVNAASLLNYLLLILSGREKVAANIQFVTLPLTILASLLAAYYSDATGVAWVFTARLTIDVFVIRMFVPKNLQSLKGGIPYSVILAWIAFVYAVYLVR